jgi:hypothetical protein
MTDRAHPPTPTPPQRLQTAWVALPGILLLIVYGLQLIGQEKPVTRGLSGPGPVVQGTPDDPLRDPREIHLRHVKQLTFGGQNAEAYFSSDGKKIVFQSTRDDHPCDQEYVMNVDGSDVHRVSNGLGRTTCGYFFDHDRKVLFSSTHLAGKDCPPPPDYSHG